MRKILAIIPSLLFWLAFVIILGGFHPVQLLAYYLGGYGPHKRSVELLNLMLIRSLHFLGTKIHFSGFDKIPEGRPLIIVSNHQSMMDIPPIIWGFRNFHAKFISKRELGRGIPSISFNLRKSGALLIDRKKGSKSVQQIQEWGGWINGKCYSAVIYPEGTRNPKGIIRDFKPGGLNALIKSMPDALIVPFSIDGNWRVFRSGMFPLEMWHQIRYTVLDAIEVNSDHPDELIKRTHHMIKSDLGQ